MGFLAHPSTRVVVVVAFNELEKESAKWRPKLRSAVVAYNQKTPNYEDDLAIKRLTIATRCSQEKKKKRIDKDTN